MRGPASAWRLLQQTPNQIDDDTLYFVYNSDDNIKEGVLYLGQKLISGKNSNGSNVQINIEDIENVDIANLQNRQILIYDQNSLQWVNASLDDIINSPIGIFQGATENQNGTSGLVPVPTRADVYSFLQGSGQWVNISELFEPDVFEINSNNYISLAGLSSAPVGTIPVKSDEGIVWANVSAGAITRQIIAYDELQELIRTHTAKDNVIYIVANDSNLYGDRYSEYMVLNNTLELLGTIGNIDLSDYVTTSVFNNRVGQIEDILNNASYGLVGRVTSLEDYIGEINFTGNNHSIAEELDSIHIEINDLTDQLEWHELNT